MSQIIKLTSIGQFASELQRSTSLIRETADRLAIKPAAIIDRVPHYNERDLCLITNAIRSEEE